jgi:hypothetical protein
VLSVRVGLSAWFPFTVAESPADSGGGSTTYAPERMNDPYVPGYTPEEHFHDSPPVVSLSRVTRGGFFDSIQVNVSLAGLNIPGDAANEPSIAIDPNNHNRIVIGWRQFDSVKSDFRQAGRAYSSDGGKTWETPLQEYSADEDCPVKN